MRSFRQIAVLSACILIVAAQAVAGYGQQNSEVRELPVPDFIRRESVSTGLLDDITVKLVNPVYYEGTESSRPASLRDWKQLYFQAYRSQIGSSSLPPLESILRGAAGSGKDPIPILIMNIRYNVLPEPSGVVGEEDLEGSFTIEGATYPERRLFAVAPSRERTYRGSETIFRIERESYISNAVPGAIRGMIDFDDGHGFREASFGEEIIVSYSRPGRKTLTTELFLDDGTVLFARSDFIVEALETPDPHDTLVVTSVIPYLGGYAGGEAYIYLAPDHLSLRNPVIVLEGFDLDNTMFWDEIYFLMNRENLIESMRLEGFDLVVLNFDEGTDYIQRNAMLAVELVEEVRAFLSPGKSMVMIGASMGGLVGRYALAYMEFNGMDHGMETFISFDAPHRGANIPLGIQYWMDFFSGQSAEAAYLLERLDTPAARQMLLYHHTDPPGSTAQCDPLKTELEADFEAVGGYPSMPRKVAVANGSGYGAGQGYPPGEQLIFYEYNSFLVDIRGNVWAVGDGSATQIFEGLIDMLWPLPDDRMNVTVSGAEPFDSAPGGCRFTMVQMDTTDVPYGDIVALRQKHCFTPTVSALDMETDDLYHDIAADPNIMSLTPFDTIYYASANTEHVEINSENAKWFSDEVRRTLTGDEGPGGDLPSVPLLAGNVPNPFNPSTKISFDLPVEMHVEISVFDIAGRKVTSLLEKKVPAGAHEVFWNGTDGRGKPVASGVYLCRLSAAGHHSSIKMVLLR